jgi:hypothetical protein
VSVPEYTFKGNRSRDRHGWLRLTPAYSVQLVEELISTVGPNERVLDPFCGSGTTALTCATRGLACDTVDINPFLIWFAGAKVACYSADAIDEVERFARGLQLDASRGGGWLPALHAIEKWWEPGTLQALSGIRQAIVDSDLAQPARDLLNVAFCRTLIERSRASFRHQSMSFRHDISHKIQNPSSALTTTLSRFFADVPDVLAGAASVRPLRQPRVLLGDARHLSNTVPGGGEGPLYDVVVTSPPYPNRMSYIRELRPYMYWLGFLDSPGVAGELDWQAIGGTWGRATSNLNRWIAAAELPLSKTDLIETVERIEERHLLLGRYVRKYVLDMATHLASLRPLLRPGARVTYIIGNSRFFDEVLDTERIFAELFHTVGLEHIEIRTLRKRTSKRELFEFAVSARA